MVVDFQISILMEMLHWLQQNKNQKTDKESKKLRPNFWYVILKLQKPQLWYLGQTWEWSRFGHLSQDRKADKWQYSKL